MTPSSKATGEEVMAFAKIVVIDDSRFIENGWNVYENSFKKVVEAARIDVCLLDYIRTCSAGVYTVEHDPPHPQSAPLCFYTLATFSNVRGAWSFDPTVHCTRAVVVQEYRPTTHELLDHLRSNLAILASPLFLYATARGLLLDLGWRSLGVSKNALETAEKDVGYYAFGRDDTASENPDLAKLSRTVGAEISRLGNRVHRLSLVKGIREKIEQGEGYRWTKLFPDEQHDAYRELCKAMSRSDDFMEQRLQVQLAETTLLQDRAKTLLNVLFNLIARQDVNVSIELAKDSRTIALAAKNDSSSMKTIAVMTMLFLPATFFAALFSTPMLDWQGTPIIKPRFWVYWAFTLPCTILVLVSWYFITKRQEEEEANENRVERAKVVKRSNTFINTAEEEAPARPTPKQKTQNLIRRLPRWRQDDKAE